MHQINEKVAMMGSMESLIKQEEGKQKNQIYSLN